MYIADLHIHSKHSRATSRDCDLQHLDLWASKKGIGLIGTGDFTHPAWRAELKERLISDADGVYRLREEFRLPDSRKEAPRFVLSSEISCIYKKDGKVRKVHNVILLPDLEAAETLSQKLEAIGNIHSDGRPILGLDSRDLLEITLECCPQAIFIPAHIWTPHFSLFGAFSGFDTLEDCFGDLSDHIHALETGLSSDPPMNWRVPSLDRYTLVSNSDAHSPAKLGREANLVDTSRDFPGLKCALETGNGFCGTLEFYPEEGKYHLDGHRNCNLRISPAQTREYGGRCPVCGKKITIGVLNRVEQLAQRDEGYRPPNAKPFEHVIPLQEVIGASIAISAGGNKAQQTYEALLSKLGTEFEILRNISTDDIERAAGYPIAEGIRRLRAGKVQCLGGYDGEYGSITLFSPSELESLRGQISLFPGMESPKVAPKSKAPSAPIAKVLTESAVAREDVVSTENPEQTAAITSTNAVVSVIAGPGTGKTRTLVSRVAYLIEQLCISPAEITAVTFTNQAAAEMRERLEQRLENKRAASRLTIGTFHSICLNLLSADAEAPILIDPSEALALAEDVIAAHSVKMTPSKFLQTVSAVKNAVLSSVPPEFEAAFEDYQTRLAVRSSMDFDDLLSETLKRDFSGHRSFQYLLVDEFQDINDLQYNLIRNWSSAGKSLFVIGDPDQSIYGFRGASADCFARLKQDESSLEEIHLQRNYRSTPEILNSSLNVISHNDGPERYLTANTPSGLPVRVLHTESDFDEAIFVAKEIGRMTGGMDMLDAHTQTEERKLRSFSDIAVLCRTHHHAELIEKCLRHESIPCIVTGREDYLSDPKVRGTLGFFRALTCPKDEASLRSALKHIWNCPPDLIELAAETVSRDSVQMETLAVHALLKPWLAAVEKYSVKTREKTRKLLEEWAEEFSLESKSYTKLLEASVFYPELNSFLQTLLLGEESDIRRGTKKSYASGAVRIMTLHGSKGLEFPAVFLCGLTEGAMPLESSKRPADIQEERRLFFVGMTRAKEELLLLAPGTPSSFLEELPDNGVLTERLSTRRQQNIQQLSLF